MTKPPMAEFLQNSLDGMARGIHAARQMTKREDLPIRQVETMLVVLMNSGKLNAKDIAERVGLTHDGCSKVMRALEQDHGYVTSVHDENDRRYKVYYVTPKGREFGVELLRQVTGRTDFDASKLPIPTMTPPRRPKVTE